jgi:RNA polymerase sigma-70 factor (ECF subfamily)
MLAEPVTKTTTALLEGLFDLQNASAWRQFDDRFRPILVAVASRLGLEPADAADVAQETIAQFVRDYRAGKYDRTRGRLRSWVVGIARHRVAELHRTQVSRREHRGQSAIVMIPEENHLGEIWDTECRQAAVCAALRELVASSKVSERTLDAFRMHVIEDETPERVAEKLGTTVRAVYMAKHRCLARLRSVMDGMKDVYELV